MHCLEAIIGPAAMVARLKLQFPSSVLCELPQGFALIPITLPVVAEMHAVIASFTGNPPSTRRDKVEGLDEITARLSMNGKIAYIETDYFGGRGSQEAEVWLDGKSIFSRNIGPNGASGWPNSPISQALRILGVVAVPGKDEFDTVGLGKHRSTEKWAEPPKTDIFTRLKEGRGPYAKTGVLRKEAYSVEQAANMFGLEPDPMIYHEVGIDVARLALAHLLHQDMAYENEIMPIERAGILANEFLAEFSHENARYFTNSDWLGWSKNPKGGRTWSAATDATFDSGILVITPTRTGCAWFMDED